MQDETKKTKKTKKAVVKKQTIVKKQTKDVFSIPVYDLNGEEIRKITLNKEIFGVKDNKKLLSQYIKVYLANQRQGTASTKTRGEINATTKKIYKQKGTGRARHGSKKAPIFVGGGITFGPSPRDFSLKINKKQKRKALFMALSLRLKEKAIHGLSNDFLKIKPKTKEFNSFLKKNSFEKGRILIILPKLETNNLILSARNISRIEFCYAKSINPYILLKFKNIFLLEESLKIMDKHFLNKDI